MKIVFPIALVVIFILVLSSCLEKQTDPQLAAQEQWRQDTTTIGAHLRANKLNSMTDVSGVRFIIDSLAVGFPPRSNSTVDFKYTGRFLSGAIFDQGTAKGGTVSSFIGGFQIALALLPKGSKGRFYIPSGYAYGPAGTGSIPANANLMFEIHLTDVITTTTEKEKLASDTVAIDEYLAQNSITAVKDKSGLRYVITQLGTGAKPGLYNRVKIKYAGKTLLNGTSIFNGSGVPGAEFDSRVINYFYAFHVALPKLPVGSKATLYVPSGLGFGAQTITSGNVVVPANSNLIYDVEMEGIVN